MAYVPDIGGNIKHIRRSRGLSQEELAEAIGTTKSTISKYELGRRYPPFWQLQAIADALNVKSNTLFAESTHMVDEALKDEILDDEVTIYTSSEIIQIRKQRVSKSDKERLDTAFDQLNSSGQLKAVERVEELTEIPRYRRTDAPAPSPEGTDTTTAAPPENPAEDGG